MDDPETKEIEHTSPSLSEILCALDVLHHTGVGDRRLCALVREIKSEFTQDAYASIETFPSVFWIVCMHGACSLPSDVIYRLVLSDDSRLLDAILEKLGRRKDDADLRLIAESLVVSVQRNDREARRHIGKMINTLVSEGTAHTRHAIERFIIHSMLKHDCILVLRDQALLQDYDYTRILRLALSKRASKCVQYMLDNYVRLKITLVTESAELLVTAISNGHVAAVKFIVQQISTAFDDRQRNMFLNCFVTLVRMCIMHKQADMLRFLLASLPLGKTLYWSRLWKAAPYSPTLFEQFMALAGINPQMLPSSADESTYIAKGISRLQELAAPCNAVHMILDAHLSSR